MAASARIDELRHRYAAQPRRYVAPLANALREAGALEEAVTMLRAQLAEYPEHLTGHVVLGRALFDAGALADARVAFEAARALDPGNRVVLRYLGEIASLGGDQEAARRWFGRLRAADPYADDVAAQLGGGPAPPEVDDVAPDAPALDAAQDVTDVRPAEAHAAEAHSPEPAGEADAFELLDFHAVTVEPPEEPAVADSPAVGLDLAPEEPAADDGVAALDQIAAGPFATETMAGLLAAQGHTEQAIALYERLTAERPADAGLQARLDALRGAPGAAPPARSEASDADRGALLAAAFADLGATAPAVDDQPAADLYADVSFDRFFAAEPAAAPVPAAPDPDADLARFDAWLRDAAA